MKSATNPFRLVPDPAPALVRIAVRVEPWLPWRVLVDAAGHPREWPRLEGVWEGTLLCQQQLVEVRLVDERGATIEQYRPVEDLLGTGFRVESCVEEWRR